jgi:hypothetical protein
MRSHLTLVARAGLILAGATMSCVATSEPDRDHVARSTAKLLTNAGPGGQNDTHDVNSDVVVILSVLSAGSVPGTHRTTNCSGTMVTPTLVLTANHCITGDTTSPPAEVPPTVSIHDPLVAVSADTPTLKAILRTPGRIGNDLTVDFALLQLDQSAMISSALNFAQQGNQVLEQSGWASTVHVNARHPSFALPTTSPPNVVGTNHYLFPGGIFAAGYGQLPPSSACDPPNPPCPQQPRQMVGFKQIDRIVGPGAGTLQAGLWQRPESYSGDLDFIVQPGDSGGALFATATDGTRDVLGVESSFLGAVGDPTYKSVWVDITSPDGVAFLQANARDPNRQPSTHPTWFAQHPLPAGYTEWWLGDVFYTGQTCRADDADCDHWPDAVDNCPFVFNPDQTDSDDNGVGDACPFCPCDPQGDIDKDGWCGAACTPVDNKYCKVACAKPARVDNCPNVYNPGQENCNSDAECAKLGKPVGTCDAPERVPVGHSGVDVLGDACDPVPCPQFDMDTRNQLQLTGGACLPNPGGQGLQCSTGSNTVLAKTIGAHPLNGTAVGSSQPVTQVDVPLVDPTSGSQVTTSARFCQQNPVRGSDCLSAGNIRDVFVTIPVDNPGIPSRSTRAGAAPHCHGPTATSPTGKHGRTTAMRRFG